METNRIQRPEQGMSAEYAAAMLKMRSELRSALAKSNKMSNEAIEQMRKEYPSIAEEFERIQHEQYALFARKMLDYGVDNISVGTKLENEQEVKLSLTGLYFRMNDKINRLKQLVALNRDSYVATESVQDTFQDLSIYGIIAQIVANGKWR